MTNVIFCFIIILLDTNLYLTAYTSYLPLGCRLQLIGLKFKKKKKKQNNYFFMSILNYNQFGQLDDSIICNYRPFVGESDNFTIGEAFDEVKDALLLTSTFHDRFNRYSDSEELDEDVIEDMINFFDFCDYSLSDFSTCGEAYDTLYQFAEDEENEAKKELDYAEQSAIDLFSKRMEELDIDLEIRDSLLHNLRTKGTASTAYLDAVEEGDEDEQEELLERMEIAQWRHRETDYDELLASGISKEVARASI